jgi:DNA polymerase-1
MTTPLVLIDGSSYFFRAFHALPPLSNSKGQPLGAVYGVVNMVKRLIKDYDPERIAVVFDAKGKTFRDDLYPEYKANRPPMPDDLRSQFRPMIDVLDAMGLPLLIIEGVEADDVIGTLAVMATEEKVETVISTGDKDLAQLVNEHVTLINTMSNTVLDIEGVEKKFGVKPERIIDYLALIGDKSDNVPGVDKVGPKTAVKWLNEYGSFDNITANAEAIKGKVGENLRASLDYLPLSKALVTIKCDLDLSLSLDALKPEAPNSERLVELFNEYEFKTWLRAIKKEDEETQQKEIKRTYHAVKDMDVLNTLIQRIKEKKWFVFDTETTSLDVMSAALVGISLSIEKDEAFYIPLAHQNETTQLDFPTVIAALKPLFEDIQIKKIGQNLKYDINVLRHYDIFVKGAAFDTMLESYVLNSTGRHDMNTMAERFLSHETIKFEDVCGKGAKQITFDKVPVDKATEYAAEDADITLKLHQYLNPRVKAIPNLRKVFQEIEMPLMPVLADMEYQGVLIDKEILANQGTQLKERLEILEQEAFSLAGEEFNLNSPKQLKAILFEKFKLPIIKKTPTGQPSTAEPVLQELAYEFPLPNIILTYRSLTKLVSTYVDALPKRINPKTGRVHTSYNQAITATGRLSSSDPNLQNIPIRTKEGRDVRLAFIAPPKHQLLALDYSQIELRIMAHLSKDKGLLSAFSEGLDIHQATASEVFSVSLSDVTAEQRRRAKAINFGLIYGMSAFGLAKQLGVTRGEAQAYVDLYFSRYPGVLKYMDDTRKKAHDTGYVETLFGRRLYLPDINAKNKMLVNAAERTAINAPMQGTAADIIKKAMINIFDWLQETPLDVHMIMQVHDELVFEIQDDCLAEATAVIKDKMENTVKIDVPLLVSVDVGKNWEEAH